jgi:hypothetical protein
MAITLKDIDQILFLIYKDYMTAPSSSVYIENIAWDDAGSPYVVDPDLQMDEGL